LWDTNTEETVESKPTFWRNMLPPSSGLKSMQQAKLYLLPASCFAYSLTLKMEAISLWNVCWLSTDCIASFPRIQNSSKVTTLYRRHLGHLLLIYVEVTLFWFPSCCSVRRRRRGEKNSQWGWLFNVTYYCVWLTSAILLPIYYTEWF
jgi:hypothetical protein